MTENYKSLNKYFHRTRKVSLAFESKAGSAFYCC